MLHYAVIFFVIAIIAAVLGFSGIAGAASNIAFALERHDFHAAAARLRETLCTRSG